MKTPIEWYRELYQKGAGATEADIAAIQADALDGLRDRFACAALTGLLEHGAVASEQQREQLAALAYTLADAMMARRSQKPRRRTHNPRRQPAAQ